MSFPIEHARASLRLTTRRHFLRDGLAGVGGLWLASQLAGDAQASPIAESRAVIDPTKPLVPRQPDLPAKATRVIFIHLSGAPSQLELYDHKPELARLDGQDCPREFLTGKRFAFIQGTPKLLGPRAKFRQAGDAGLSISDNLPHLAGQIDKLCFLRTMRTDQINHAPAQLLTQTGDPRIGGASIGSWVTYGLGSENQNLPGFVVLLSGGSFPDAGKSAWGSGFLPGVYQGVQCRSQGDPVLYLSNPPGIDGDLRRRMIDAITRLNQQTHRELGDPATVTRIAQYELAARMQLAASDAMNLSDETKATLDHYGAQPGKERLANNCLLARRLVERGVRFVQLYDWGWDSHGNNEAESLTSGFRRKCRELDRPVAALLADLEQRGLLNETLVVCGAEFGRTPMRENRGGETMQYLGRDHHGTAYTIWLAGAGVKSGFSFGETDPIGCNPITPSTEVRDLQATILRLLGLDHQRLIYPRQGLDHKLTGVEPARVIDEVLA